MTVVTEKYRRKPLYVDAIRVTAENFVDVTLWSQGSIKNNDDSEVGDAPVDPTTQHIHIRVHNPKNPRQTKAFVGDWILYTERGYKIYTDKAFQNSFELVHEPKAVADLPTPETDGVELELVREPVTETDEVEVDQA